MSTISTLSPRSIAMIPVRATLWVGVIATGVLGYAASLPARRLVKLAELDGTYTDSKFSVTERIKSNYKKTSLTAIVTWPFFILALLLWDVSDKLNKALAKTR